jgi:hypothetical protein
MLSNEESRKLREKVQEEWQRLIGELQVESKALREQSIGLREKYLYHKE